MHWRLRATKMTDKCAESKNEMEENKSNGFRETLEQNSKKIIIDYVLVVVAAVATGIVST